VLWFLAACVLMQASHAPYYVFYSIHLEDAGYRPQAIGMLWGVAVACEVIAMLRMPAILGRFGTLPVMAGCLLLASVRWWICAATVAAPALALAQTLHAASFAAFHVAAVTHTHRLFGEDRRASGQAIYGSATYGAGNVLGMVVSGLLYEQAGMRPLFTLASWTALLGGLLVVAGAAREFRAGRGL
jgi:PPP family 3-phenylpropionic acid transporter